MAGWGARHLDIGRVAELTFGLAGRDFAVNYAIALVLSAPAALAASLMAQGAAQAQMLGRASLFGPGLLAVGLLNLALGMLAYGAMIAGSLERLQGRVPTLQARLAPAVRALPTLLGVAVLGYLGLLVGFLLLIVPGLILAAMWIVVLPVAVAETRNVVACFSRSAALTRGVRLPILLTLLVVWVGSLVIGGVAILLIHMALGLGGSPFFVRPTGPLAYVAAALQLMVGGLVRVVWAAGLAALFHELRSLKGGPLASLL